MAKGKLFEYVILHHPRVTRDAAGNDITGPSTLLTKEVQQVLAVSEKEAQIHASRAIPAELMDRLEEVEIAIRPF